MFGTWLMQTSFKPPLVAFALSKDSRTLANVLRDRAFAVSFLTDGMEDLAQNVLDEAFDKVNVDRTPSGLPTVRGGSGWLECKFLSVLAEGDHHVVLAEVAEAGAGAGKLLPLDALGWHYGG